MMLQHIKTHRFTKEFPDDYIDLIIINHKDEISDGYSEGEDIGIWFNEQFYNTNEIDLTGWRWIYRNNIIFD